MRHGELGKACHLFRWPFNQIVPPLSRTLQSIAQAYRDGGIKEVFRKTMRRFFLRSPKVRWLTDLQSVSCAVCGTDDTSVVVPNYPAPIVRCNNCGLHYYNPRPTERALREYYSIEAAGAYTQNIRMWGQELSAQMTQLWIEDFLVVEQWVSRYMPGQRIRFLEIGCAPGFQLSSAKRKGWEPVGVELSEPIVVWMKEEFGLDVVHGTIEEAAAILPKESFDVILMSHVVEHMPHPRSALQTAFSLLKPGGLIIIYVPNGDGIQARNDFRNWEWKGFPDHLHFFTSPSLARLLTECGFRVESMWTCVGHSNPQQLFGLIQQCLNLDSLEQAKRVAEVLGPMCLLSDLRVVTRKPQGVPNG